MKRLKYLLSAILLTVTALCYLCGCGETTTGEFYTLEEAYELGFLSTEDLEQIAYYHNNGIEYPEPLNKQTDRAIRETEARNYRSSNNDCKVKLSGFRIKEYDGCYNGYYAVMIESEYFFFPCLVTEREINGISFCYSDMNSIVIWKR